MSGRLAGEIHQSKPFASVEEEALLNLSRTYSVVDQRLSNFLKPHSLSPTQYNVLRILRGAGDEGAACSQVAARMVHHDPDVTRLMDRLEKRGLVARTRGREDRRVVRVKITPAGLEVLSLLDLPLIEHIHEMAAGLSAAELAHLITLLEKLRAGPLAQA